MRVSFSTNVACQPLRPMNFGKAAENNPQIAQKKAPAFTSADSVSRKEYDAAMAKYDLACRLLCVQAEQYKKLAANYAPNKK